MNGVGINGFRVSQNAWFAPSATPPIGIDPERERSVRRVAHGSVFFSPDVEPQVLRLMKLQCSAVRSAYQAVYKHGLEGNAVKNHVKRNFMVDLNQRYVSDACTRASQVTQKGALFGGKREWEKLRTGLISKEDWQARRNNQLYSQGDKSRKGNPNIRIDGGRLLINDPAQRRKWIEGKVFLPAKWTPDWTCYSVQLLHKGEKFTVNISWEEAAPPVTTSKARGVLAVDSNPDGLGIAVLSQDGNLLAHEFKQAQRIPFASQDKRDNDVRLLAKSVVEEAKVRGVPVALERLAFKSKGRAVGYKKFRRTKANFLYGKVIEAITSRAARNGVEVIPVQPAFTSVLGCLRYAQTYSLNRHTAAALVVGRRALGYRERCDFTVTPSGKSGDRLTLEGRGRSQTLSLKAYSWLQTGDFLLKGPKKSSPHRSVTGPRMSLGIGDRAGGIPAGESSTTTGRGGRDV